MSINRKELGVKTASLTTSNNRFFGQGPHLGPVTPDVPPEVFAKMSILDKLRIEMMESYSSSTAKATLKANEEVAKVVKRVLDDGIDAVDFDEAMHNVLNGVLDSLSDSANDTIELLQQRMRQEVDNTIANLKQTRVNLEQAEAEKRRQRYEASQGGQPSKTAQSARSYRQRTETERQTRSARNADRAPAHQPESYEGQRTVDYGRTSPYQTHTHHEPPRYRQTEPEHTSYRYAQSESPTTEKNTMPGSNPWNHTRPRPAPVNPSILSRAPMTFGGGSADFERYYGQSESRSEDNCAPQDSKERYSSHSQGKDSHYTEDRRVDSRQDDVLSHEQSLQMQEILDHLDTDILMQDDDEIVDIAKMMEQSQQSKTEPAQSQSSGQRSDTIKSEQPSVGYGTESAHGFVSTGNTPMPHWAAGGDGADDMDDVPMESHSRGSQQPSTQESGERHGAQHQPKSILGSDFDLDAELSSCEDPQAYMQQLEKEAQEAYEDYQARMRGGVKESDGTKLEELRAEVNQSSSPENSQQGSGELSADELELQRLEQQAQAAYEAYLKKKRQMSAGN